MAVVSVEAALPCSSTFSGEGGVMSRTTTISTPLKTTATWFLWTALTWSSAASSESVVQNLWKRVLLLFRSFTPRARLATSNECKTLEAQQQIRCVTPPRPLRWKPASFFTVLVWRLIPRAETSSFIMNQHSQLPEPFPQHKWARSHNFHKKVHCRKLLGPWMESMQFMKKLMGNQCSN